MIKLDSFHCSQTYAGLLACSPEIMEESGNALLQDIKDNPSQQCKLHNIWGERTTYHVAPRNVKGGVFPKWKCFAWLDGPPKVPFTGDPKENLARAMRGEPADYGDGAELVVVWWQDSVPEDPVRAALAALDSVGKTFAELARDYQL